jgi:hypothetical protein
MGSQNYHSPISGTPDVRTAVNTALGEIDAAVVGLPTGQIAVFGESVSNNAVTSTPSSDGSEWTRRALAGLEEDGDGIVSISSNQFTPMAGTYLFVGSAYGNSSAGGIRHRLRLYNVTGDSLVKASQGTSEDNAMLQAVFTANGSDEYRIDHYYTGGSGTVFSRVDGISPGPDEVYAQFAMIRVGQ